MKNSDEQIRRYVEVWLLENEAKLHAAIANAIGASVRTHFSANPSLPQARVDTAAEDIKNNGSMCVHGALVELTKEAT